MEANTKTKNELTKDELIKIPLLVASELTGIHKQSGQEVHLVFGGKIDYDENGKNPVVWYKTQEPKMGYKEYERDFLAFQKAKEAFFAKHRKVVAGFQTEIVKNENGYVHRFDLITDDNLLHELYDMEN